MNVQEALLAERIDPFLSKESVGALISRAVGEDVAVRDSRVLTGGCWNRVIGVDLVKSPEGINLGVVVCKISPNPNDSRLIREYDVLEYFDEYTEMPVPKPLLIDASGKTVPGTALVMTMILGSVLHGSFGYLSGESREAVSRQLAEYVCDLHTVTASGFGGVELPASERCASWAEFWLPRFDGVISEVQNGDYITDAMLDEIRFVRPGFEGVLDIGGFGTLTHYDIWSGNVMVDARADPAKVTGFIDIPGFFADYAREISFMLMFGMADDTFFRIYSSVHDFDPGFEVRINMYNLKMHLKHITMYPHETYYREGARRCLEHIKSNLA